MVQVFDQYVYVNPVSHCALPVPKENLNRVGIFLNHIADIHIRCDHVLFLHLILRLLTP